MTITESIAGASLIDVQLVRKLNSFPLWSVICRGTVGRDLLFSISIDLHLFFQTQIHVRYSCFEQYQKPSAYLHGFSIFCHDLISTMLS